jgi:adhesin/invasin
MAKYAADSGDGQTGTAGKPLANPFKVLVTDAVGTPVPGASVTFTVTGGGGNLGGSSSAIINTNAQGLAEATLTLGPAPNAANTVQATSSFGGNPLKGSPVNFTATSAPPQDFLLVGQNTFSGTANMPLADSLKVKVKDTLGNPLADFPVVYSVTLGGGKIDGKTSPQTILTGSDGIARAEWTLGPMSGQNNNKVEATATFNNQPIGPAIVFTASAAVAPASDLVKISGDSLSGVIQNPLPGPFVVKVTDGNNPIKDWPVKFKVIAGGGNFGGLDSVTVATDSSGNASATLTLGNTAGAYNNLVEASSENDGNPLNGSPIMFRATATASNASTLSLLSSSNLSGQAGEPISETIQVRVTDDASNNIESHPVKFAVTVGAGTVDGTTDTVVVKQTNADGIASVVWYLGSAIGSNSHKLEITANDGVNPLKNSPIILQADAIAGPVDSLRSFLTSDVSQLPADGQSKANITVTLTDRFGNPVKDKAVIILSSGGTDIINQPTSLTDANGKAVGTIASTKSGTRTITARDLTDGIDLNNGTNVEFKALAPKTIEESSGNNQTANIGTALSQPIVVIVRDMNSNPVPGVNVDFVVTAGGGSILNLQEQSQGDLSKSTVGIITDSTGKASAQWILGQKPGTNTAEARVSGLTGSPVPFTANGVNANPTVLALYSGNTQEGIAAGDPLPEPLKVKVTDANGKPVWNVPVTFSVELGGGTVSDGNTVTDFEGIAQTTLTLGATVGTNIVKASSSSLPGQTVTFTLQSIVGTPAILTDFEGNGGSGVVNSLYQILVLITDINNNPVEGTHAAFEVIEGGATIESSQSATTANGTASASVRLPTNVGTVKVKATSNDLPGFFKIFTIFVVSGSATDIAEYSGNNQTGTIDRELVFPFQVIVTDAFGNPVAGERVPWVVTKGTGTLKFSETRTDEQGIASNYITLGNQVGTYEARAVTALNPSQIVFTAIGVNNSFPLFIGLADTSVVEGNLLLFQVEAQDADNDPLTYEAQNLPSDATFNPSTRTFKWTPTEQQAGEYQVTFIVRDNQGGLDSETITITVKNSNNPPEVIAWNPPEFQLVFPQGGTIFFSVTATDADGDSLIYRWRNNGILVSTGSQYELITSSFSPGTDTITVDVSDNQDVVSLKWEVDIVVSVELASFQAQFDGFSGVNITWSTSREIDNLGFNVLRSLTRNGDFTKLNDKLILSNRKGDYQFFDLNVEVGKRYFYILEDVDIRGEKTQHGPISVNISAPNTYELSQNYPNPFNPETKIRYQLPQPGRVVIKIYNVLGSEVKTLVDDYRNAGFHVVTWDATDNFGRKVSTGIYYYRIASGKFNSTKKMLLMK